MLFYLLLILIFELVIMLVWGLIRRGRIIQFPFLAAASFTAYLLPQCIGMAQDTSLPDGAAEKTIFMAILCLAAGHLGYVTNRKPARFFNDWKIDPQRLAISSLIFVLLGSYFYQLVTQLAGEANETTGGQWTGIITIYVFFSGLLTFGLVLALNLHLRKSTWITLGVVLLGCALYLTRIIIFGRRGPMVELALFVILPLWFHNRKIPPKWLTFTGIVLATLIINSAGDYRSTMLTSDGARYSGVSINEILAIDYLGNLRNNFNQAGFDILNAANYIDSVDHSMALDYGTSLYNSAVTLYVPAQIFGTDFKQMLTVDFGTKLKVISNTGSTLTGFGDAFGSYWYFGAIKFYLIGLICSRWFKAAEHGNMVAQLISLLIAYQALVSFSFSTNIFFLRFFDLFVFILPVLLYARVRPARLSARNRI